MRAIKVFAHLGCSPSLWLEMLLLAAASSRGIPNTARLRFFDENYKEEDAINRRQDNNHCFVLTAIYRVSYPNRTVLEAFPVGDWERGNEVNA
jgi:hypothetical protein